MEDYVDVDSMFEEKYHYDDNNWYFTEAEKQAEAEYADVFDE